MKGGFNTYEIPIGILMLHTMFPRVRGDIGNAATFPFPVRYRTVRGASPDRVVLGRTDPALLAPFIAAARELESEGVKAITTSCGFLAIFQEELAASVSIPVFASSLMQVPVVARTLNGRQKVGVLTANKSGLTEDHFRGAGWSTSEIPVIVEGLEDKPEFMKTHVGNGMEADFGIIRDEVVGRALEMVERHPEIGAFVFECTNLPPYSRDVALVTGRPVYDIVTLTHMVYTAVKQRCYVCVCDRHRG
ncbi:MAG: aspartate/glutamate racemase family protein [Firmicutes bacterium]|nr:aspartate/glutamate racemase family protein [Bacillota bacterium]